MIEHLNELIDAGITSFKIEGRMKSEYYVANVVNAYFRALNNKNPLPELKAELQKCSHRQYTTGFYFNAKDKECLETSMPIQTHEFMALVLETYNDGYIKIEQRNRFKVGDTLEILSPSALFNMQILVKEIKNENGEQITDAKQVQSILYLGTDLPIKQGDILRKKI